MINKGIVTATVATAAILSSSAFASKDLLQLDNSALDSITGAGAHVEVTTTASGSGTTSGQTVVAGYSVSSSTYPTTIVVAGGGAVACCGDVETTATASSGVTDPSRISLDASIHETVSGLGISVSIGFGFAINTFY